MEAKLKGLKQYVEEGEALLPGLRKDIESTTEKLDTIHKQ